VPSKSRRTDHEEYAFNDNAAPAENTEPEIAFHCPVCHTRMTAPKDQVGQQQNCPDCRTPVRVPAKLPPRRRKQAAPVDAYVVCEDFDPATPPAPQPEYIAVYCGRCGTLMQITPDRVGSKVLCPDCKKATVVEAPRLRGQRNTSTTTESYEVTEEIGQSPVKSVANQAHVGFVCQCGTRLHALVSEAGQQRNCPDCGRSVTVPSPRPKRPKPDLTKEISGQYGTQAETTVNQQTSAAYQPPIWFSDRFKKTHDERGRLRPAPKPPRWPLVSGVFTFPWRRGVLAKWVWLSVGATLIAEMGLLGWSMGKNIGLGAGIGAAGPAVLSMLFQLLAGCLAVCWTGVFFINLLAILGDTAAGADEVGHWPEAIAFIDWAGSTFFVINSLLFSVLAGQGLGWLLRQSQLPGVYAMIAVPIVLFPFLLLSTLEANSPLVPISKVVWRSLFRKWRAWAVFYLESIPVLAVPGASAVAATLSSSLLWAIPVLAMMTVASLMIYFRLLGRLAWCCAR
jgi:DNA-directed RNA polymerase subunit M/transcription elongation factor TFIIS